MTDSYWRCEACKELYGKNFKQYKMDDLIVCEECYEGVKE